MSRKWAGGWHGISGWLGLMVLLVATEGKAQVEAPMGSVPERVYLNYLEEPVTRLAAGSTGRDFFFRLPAHVRFGEGSALHMVLRADGIPWEEVCRVRVRVNRRVLYDGGPGPDLMGTEEPRVLRLSLPLEASILEADWNRISLQVSWRTPLSTGRKPAETDAAWVIRDTDSFISFVFERLPLFPELRRFPSSLTEELWLRSPFVGTGEEPGVSLLLPERRGDVHLRAVALLGAALGKPGNLQNVSVGTLSGWPEERLLRNGLMVGTVEELGGLDLPEAWRESMTGLAKGQGWIAEHIVGTFPNERRWIVLSGGDTTGLEKALLTLVNVPGLVDLPPNPAVVDVYPSVTEPTLPADGGEWVEVPLRADLPGAWWFRGMYETRRALAGWVLPPTYETGPGGFVDLAFSHSTNLAGDSFFDVTVQGRVLGRVGLEAASAAGGQARMRLPEGMVGSGAMPVQVRAHLNVPGAECQPPPEEQAWLRLSENPTLTFQPRPVAVEDLRQAQAFLYSDPHLRRTTFLVPEDADEVQLTWLFDLARRMGERMAQSPFLWPEVRGYGPDRFPHVEQLRDRSVLLLGSVSQWPQEVLASTDLLVRPGRRAGEVMLQGRRHKVQEFEPSLAFLNLVKAPWEAGARMLVAGGWETFAMPALTRLMTEPEAMAGMFGLCSVRDGEGRATALDPRLPGSESLGACLLRDMPRGLSVQDTLLLRYEEQARARLFAQRSFLISVWTGLVLVLLVMGRVWLLWERGRLERHVHMESRGETT